MSGPTHSNRNFQVMRSVNITEGKYIIEVWSASNFNKDKGTREEVPGAIDIKVYKKDENKEYNKGEAVFFVRAFDNQGKPKAPSYQTQGALSDDDF